MSNEGEQSWQSIGAAQMFGAFAPPSGETQPEMPEMRSMAVLRSGPTLQLPPGGLGISKPPPLGIARPGKLSARSQSESLKVQQTWTGVTLPSAWDVKGEDLELVPMDYPLERTHRTIEGVDATEVAKRISNALRTHSIEAKYATKPVKVKCKTNDMVSFRIRLYAAGENGLPVVVEVQRRSGPASSFMKTCRALLAAAEGKLDSVAPTKKTPPMMKPIGQMKCLQSISLPPIPIVATSDEEIALVAAMVRSDKKDSNELGLENLIALTDPIKTSPGIASAVSKCVVLGDIQYDIREDIRAFTDRDMFEDEAEEEEAVLKHAERVRHLALTVFANGLAVCSSDGSLKAALEEQAWFKENFMSPLVDELKLCDTSACCALEASRCIGSLLESSSTAKRFLLSCGVVQVLEDAHQYGKACNDMLAEETARCLKLLDV